MCKRAKADVQSVVFLSLRFYHFATDTIFYRAYAGIFKKYSRFLFNFLNVFSLIRLRSLVVKRASWQLKVDGSILKNNRASLYLLL